MNLFSAHCHEVVREYVQNVMIIDDGAQLNATHAPSTGVMLNTPVSTNPLISSFRQMGTKENRGKIPPDSIHPLDTLSLTNAFFEEGIVAGIYQPKILDNQTPEQFASIARSACEKADIIILDWILKNRSSDFSKAIVKEILRSDNENGGKIRAIMIYTGESRLNDLRDELCDYLTDYTLDRNIDFEIHSSNLIISFYNKDHQAYDFSPERAVSEADIPAAALKSFSILINGLVPAFAIKAAAAIRKNTGRIISRFGKNLDSGYLAHRVLLPRPDDSEVFMLENFISYMRNILAISRVDNSTLGACTIEKWIKYNDNTLAKKITHEDITCQIELSDMIQLSKNGFSGNLSKVIHKKNSSISKNFCDISKKPSLDAISIFDTEKTKVINSSIELSILSSFRRTFKDIVGINESPYLTQGSLIYSKNIDQFMLCITPKCDTVRINNKLNFSFVALDEVTDGKFDIVIPRNASIDSHKKLIHDFKKFDIAQQIVENVLSHNKKPNKSLIKQFHSFLPYESKEYTLLHTTKKFHKLEHIVFETDERKRVLSSNTDPDTIIFWDEDCHEYIWIGDLHDLNTISRVGNLVSNLNRTGTDEVEWLRRNAR
ncbi:response regulator receiver domain [Serratia sp. H402Y]|uniref:response regulator receiver domain n=1 Tax=Serratia sp. H402Y TaxID=3444320 RepID=UPI003EBCA3D7